MKSTIVTNFFILLEIFVSYGKSDTLRLPITINQLVQDAIERDDFTDSIIKLNAAFFGNITLSDIVKDLNIETLPQLRKSWQGLVILGLAAQNNGLTVDKFEYVQTSKWTIIMTVEQLANVSDNITLPLNNEVALITIQEAMFKILEKKFNFKTEEIVENFNTTKDEVYAFLEPGWIKVVNFITKKNILALSRNYSISPLHIAEALNMSLQELYNLTLPQLEDTLINKNDLIKELSRYPSTTSSPTVSAMYSLLSNSMGNSITKNAVKSSFIVQTDTKTLSKSNELSSYQTFIYKSSNVLTSTLESSKNSFRRNVETDITPLKDLPMTSSFTDVESSLVSEVKMLKLTTTRTDLNLYTSIFVTATQSQRSTILKSGMMSNIHQLVSPTSTERAVEPSSTYDLLNSIFSRTRRSTTETRNMIATSYVIITHSDGNLSPESSKIITTTHYSTRQFLTRQQLTSSPADFILVKSGDAGNATKEDDLDTVLIIVLPIIGVIFLADIAVAIVLWMRHKRRKKRAKKKIEELSGRVVVERSESDNDNNNRAGVVNKGADDM